LSKSVGSVWFLLGGLAVVVGIALAVGFLAKRRVPKRDPNMISVSADDPRMLAAKAEARASLPDFLKRFEARDDPKVHYLVKAEFDGPTGAEFIWVECYSYADGVIGGKLANEPDQPLGLHARDNVDVTLSHVDDWMIMGPKGTEGGFTTKVLRQIEAERK